MIEKGNSIMKAKNSPSIFTKIPQLNISDQIIATISPYVQSNQNYNPFDQEPSGQIKFIRFYDILSKIGIDNHPPLAMVSHKLNYASTLHYHDYVEMTYIAKGKILNVVDQVPYIMKTGSLSLLKPQIPHLIAKLPNESELPVIVNILVDAKLLEHFKDNVGLTNPLETIFKNLPFIIISQEEMITTNHTIQDFIINYYQNHYQYNISNLGYLLAILGQIEVLMTEQVKPLSNLTKDCLQLIRSEIKAINVKYLSQQLNYSQGYLSRLIKKETGRTLTEWIRSEKLRLAEDYIRIGETQISEIADLIGYKSESHFYQAFKAEFHMTPKQYQKIMRKE